MSPTHDELLALLDYRSEQEIETNLAKGIYGPDKRSLAELVLARKKLARMEAERAAEIEVTRRATEAAWENAKTARDAEKRATWAILISIASIAIAVATAMF
jgi:thiamine kinase-like enzyme